ncbi:hypothetical protein M5689_000605 [Euphorbia peplus]|nr:hypothetical protein M5689_000605 [Euphorbia peplus]
MASYYDMLYDAYMNGYSESFRCLMESFPEDFDLLQSIEPNEGTYIRDFYQGDEEYYPTTSQSFYDFMITSMETTRMQIQSLEDRFNKLKISFMSQKQEKEENKFLEEKQVEKVDFLIQEDIEPGMEEVQLEQLEVELDSTQ